MGITTHKREIWTPPKAEIRLHNHFRLELRNRKTGKLELEADAYNVVTNYGKGLIAASVGFSYTFDACVVGTGTNAPSATDEYMGYARSIAELATQAQVGTYTTINIDHTLPLYWFRKKYQFKETVGNFSLTEVGLYRLSNANGESFDLSAITSTYFGPKVATRALFRDANGNPITVTKTSNQIMTITATVYLERGGADQNMVLLDAFFARLIRQQGFGLALQWGDAAGTLDRGRTTLAGSQTAIKFGAGTSINRWWWDEAAAQWLENIRPSNKPYSSSFCVDWELNEALATFREIKWVALSTISEYYVTAPSEAAVNGLMYMVLPCGNVAASEYTKTNQTKLRQYFEIVWGP